MAYNTIITHSKGRRKTNGLSSAEFQAVENAQADVKSQELVAPIRDQGQRYTNDWQKP